jgi:hypothetical protein
MIEEALVKKKLEQLLQYQISLEGFEDWLSVAAWNMFRDSSSKAIDLVSSIHLMLDEYHDHILRESDLRNSFVDLLSDAIHVEFSDNILNPWTDKPQLSFTSDHSVLLPVAVRV